MPRSWPVQALDPQADSASDGDNGSSPVMTGVCERDRQSPASVFSFTAPEAGEWIFETGAHSDGRGLDTLIELRTHCGFGAPNFLQCNDDGGPNFFSRARWRAMAGEIIYIIVGGFGDEVGGFSIRAVRAAE